MKWSEAKDKAKEKVWAFLELRPTGRVLTKEQYDYAMYYAKHTGIDCSYIRSFEEEKGKYLRLGNWFGGAGYIRTIDTSKTWRLSYNHVDAPVIDYVQVSTNKYGYLSVL